ncbi:MAG: universal stress protein [Actinobacteria bacterium]|jgi:nucleotide-binding universal stress UspA family protein|nr:universal stress protein [Actinomycetota bacterium]
MGKIVVGVNGSDPSTAALTWAVDEARLRGYMVEAVLAYDLKRVLGSNYPQPATKPGVDLQARMIRARAQDLLHDTLRCVDAGQVTVEPILRERSNPVDELVQRSHSAELLVLGTGRRSRFSHRFNPSIAVRCLDRARCPVVIVPEPNEPT